ncbi:cell surface glycoprotein 1-like [Salvia splendens]|uniref:cell surface glycoprotein 1-like n=1 Tax=Salvia splendens TaxID=180675 RepID=UPI001C261F64|nr:cell surface glycoprotein 1-like [Salvia splendens]
MGKKKMARKQTTQTPPSICRDETPELQPPTEEQLPNSQPQEPIPQASAMVFLNALAEFLKQQDPNKDWAAALASFSQVGDESSTTGETPIVPTPKTNVQPTVHPPTSIPTSSTIPPEKKSPSTTAPSESSNPSPTRQQIETMDVDPLSANYDYLGECEGKSSEEQKSREEENESERTLVAEPVPQ